MCGLPAAGYSFDPPNLHSAIMTCLEVGELYSYTISEYDPARTFRAPPPRGPSAQFSFIVYGDMGESEHRAAKSPGARTTSSHVADEVLGGGAEMVLHIGDISYANGDLDIWDTFMDYIEPYAAAAPYTLGIGNHEYDWRTGGEKRHKHWRATDASGADRPYDPDWGNYGNDSGGECGVAVARRFLMPGSAGLGGITGAVANVSGGAACRRSRAAAEPNPPFWYSFDYGSVHFTVVSTEHDLTAGSEQREWLEADLAAVDRCETPWLAVAMQRPMYVVFPHKSNRVVGEHLRDSLEDLFEDAEVDLVLSGHVHAYARTCNVLNERCLDSADGGMTHFTIGCGGRKLSDVEHDQPEWLAYAEPEWGFGRVRVQRGGELLFEFVRSEDGTVRDAVRLRNRRADARACQHGAPYPNPNPKPDPVTVPAASSVSEGAAPPATGAGPLAAAGHMGTALQAVSASHSPDDGSLAAAAFGQTEAGGAGAGAAAGAPAAARSVERRPGLVTGSAADGGGLGPLVQHGSAVVF